MKFSEICQFLSEGEQEAVVASYGGTRAIVPKQTHTRRKAFKLMSKNSFTKVVAHAGGEAIYIPIGKKEIKERNERIKAGREAGASIERLSLIHNLSARQIFFILAKKAIDE